MTMFGIRELISDLKVPISVWTTPRGLTIWGEISSLRYLAVLIFRATVPVFTPLFPLFCTVFSKITTTHDFARGSPTQWIQHTLNQRVQVSPQTIVGVSLPVGSLTSRTTSTFFGPSSRIYDWSANRDSIDRSGAAIVLFVHHNFCFVVACVIRTKVHSSTTIHQDR